MSLLRRHKIMTLEQARVFLEDTVARLATKPYQVLCRSVLSAHEFWEFPAAKGRHQAYPGGLAIHTAQVLCTALDMLSANNIEDE